MCLQALQGKTSPPDYLTESELIGLMEKHGIGTGELLCLQRVSMQSQSWPDVCGCPDGMSILPTGSARCYCTWPVPC